MLCVDWCFLTLIHLWWYQPENNFCCFLFLYWYCVIYNVKDLDSITVRVEFCLAEIKPSPEFIMRVRKCFSTEQFVFICCFSFSYYGNDGRDYKHLSYEQPHPGEGDRGQAHIGEFLQQPNSTA